METKKDTLSLFQTITQNDEHCIHFHTDGIAYYVKAKNKDCK